MKMVKYCYCMQAKIKHAHSFYLGIDDFEPVIQNQKIYIIFKTAIISLKK